MTEGAKRGYHDIGGMAGGPVDRVAKAAPRWSQLIDVIRERSRAVSLHEQRRKIEEMGPALYDSLGYYEIRALAVKRLLIEKGVLGEAELDARMERIRAQQRQGE
ncbi:MAG: hypothetical protein AB7K86_18780 [Rhodospirillales bacterium]